MTNTNGWTMHEYKQCQDLIIKANWQNLVEMYNQVAQEIGTRNVNKGMVAIKRIKENEEWIRSGLKPCGHTFKEYCDCDNYFNE
jgi:hypothetical protein